MATFFDKVVNIASGSGELFPLSPNPFYVYTVPSGRWARCYFAVSPDANTFREITVNGIRVRHNDGEIILDEGDSLTVYRTTESGAYYIFTAEERSKP